MYCHAAAAAAVAAAAAADGDDDDDDDDDDVTWQQTQMEWRVNYDQTQHYIQYCTKTDEEATQYRVRSKYMAQQDFDANQVYYIEFKAKYCATHNGDQWRLHIGQVPLLQPGLWPAGIELKKVAQNLVTEQVADHVAVMEFVLIMSQSATEWMSWHAARLAVSVEIYLCCWQLLSALSVVDKRIT